MFNFRKFDKLLPSTKPIAEGINPSALKNLKWPNIEDFQGQPFAIVDFRIGKVLKPMSWKEYDALFSNRMVKRK